MKSNLFFKVGAAPIHEPITVKEKGELVTYNDGMLFTVMLYEDGKFRIRTNFHVSEADYREPDFQKSLKKTLEEHRQFLTKHFEMFRQPGKIISLT